MIPAPHPSLDTGPAARPICSGCGAQPDTTILVPICEATPTAFICGACAVIAWGKVCNEALRRGCEAILDCDPLMMGALLS